MAQASVSKRDFFAQAIKRIENEVNTQLDEWNFFHAEERAKKLYSEFEQFQQVVLEIVCNEQTKADVKSECEEKLTEIEALYYALMPKLREKMAASKTASEASGKCDSPPTTSDMIKQTDYIDIGKFGGIPDWEKFDAQIKAKLVDKQLSNKIKFDSLLKACVGTEAEGIVLGLSDNDFGKAYAKLDWLFGSKYKQTQYAINKLVQLPKLIYPNGFEISSLVNRVVELIKLLEQNHNTELQMWVPFVVISKMDAETRFAWERQLKIQAQSWSTDEKKMRDFVPDWNAVKLFLSEEAELLLQNFGDTSDEDCPDKQAMDMNAMQAQKGQSKTKVSKPASDEAHCSYGKNNVVASTSGAQATAPTPHRMDCVLCGPHNVHALFKCPKFLAKTIEERVMVVSEQKLCMKCFEANHDGQCKNPKSNWRCERCKPEWVFHNSTLCDKNVFTAKPMVKQNTKPNANDDDDWNTQ